MSAFRWGTRTYVMGIVNVTPDSFSGDGLAGDAEAAVAQALRMAAEGADIIDVGGMSTRPTHTEVPVAEELARVMDVLPEIVRRAEVPVSVDTYRSEVAEAALGAGAEMLNDVWGLQRDPRLAALAAEADAWLVLMHNQQGTAYTDLVGEMLASLGQSVQTALAAGMPRQRLIVDPGIGFGKTAEQNVEVLSRLAELKALGLPMLLGTSRKSFIGRILDLPPDERVEGTAASVALGIAGGADIVRVHDVAAMVRVCRVTDAIVRGTPLPAAR